MMETIKHKKIYTIPLILSSGILLCFWAFYNKYPLVFPDTGTYVVSGFTNVVPIDRPLMYGLFLRHVSLAESLWLVIWIQGILLSLLVYYYFRYLSPSKKFLPGFVIYIFLITFLTGASVNTSQLIPDIFTPIAILSMGLLIFVGKLKLRDIIIISILMVAGISVHTSHVMIMALLGIILTLLYILPKSRVHLAFIHLKRILLIWGLIIFSFLFVSLVHYSFGGGFTISKGKHVFLMGRLIDMEIVNEYLQDNCDEKDYALCEYKDEVIWDFIWDYSNSPLYKAGGWDSTREEYNMIIRDILTSPKYLKKFLVQSFESSFIQFFNYETGDTPQMVQHSAPYREITRFYNGQEKQYLSSRQSNNKLEFSFLNNYQHYIFALSLLFTILLLIIRIPGRSKLLISYFLLALYINAAVCGALSGISPRYQSRIIWLLPLPIILTLLDREIRRSILGKQHLADQL